MPYYALVATVAYLFNSYSIFLALTSFVHYLRYIYRSVCTLTRVYLWTWIL